MYVFLSILLVVCVLIKITRKPSRLSTMEVPLIHPMIRADLASVVDIEYNSFEHPWEQKDFVLTLRDRHTIGLTAKFEEEVVGYIVYEIHKTYFHILNIAVHPDFLRRGVGKTIINKMKAKLSNGGDKTRLKLEVRESNLDAHLFWRSMGFRAIGVKKKWFNDVDEDAYVFVYRNKQLSNVE